METRSMRRRKRLRLDLPPSFRAFIIQKTWNMHTTVLLFLLLGCAIGFARVPEPLNFPFLAGGGWVPPRLMDPRLWVTVVLVAAYVTARAAPVFYAANYEVACDVVHLFCLLARHASMFHAGAENAVSDTVRLFTLVRPMIVIGGALSLRYECRKQDIKHALRIALDVPLNLCRRMHFGETSFDDLRRAGVFAGVLGREIRAWGASVLLFVFVSHLLERRDGAEFRKLMRRRRLERHMQEAAKAGGDSGFSAVRASSSRR
jgi:hypothetical protein